MLLIPSTPQKTEKNDQEFHPCSPHEEKSPLWSRENSSCAVSTPGRMEVINERLGGHVHAPSALPRSIYDAVRRIVMS